MSYRISITVVREGHWEGKRYICESDSHPGRVTIGENEGGPDTVTREVRCDRGGWHQLSFPEAVQWRDRPLWLRRLRSLLTRTPGYSHCQRCWASWDMVGSQSVDYRHGSACFFLCVACWRQTGVDERLAYGRRSWEMYWQPRLWEGRPIGEPWTVYERAIRAAS